MAGEKILVVDDEPGVRFELENILRDEGFEVSTAASGEEGLERAAATDFDAIFLDIWLPGIDGIETLSRLRDGAGDAEIVMISGHGTIETAVRATKLGAYDFVEKPLSLEKTLLVLRNALRQRFLERSNRRLLERLSRGTEIIGNSHSAERLRRQVEAASGSDAPVLIVGERGTGRESVARRIHSLGNRSEEAYLEITCAALDSPALEEALFGSGGKPGRLAVASGGTVYLEDADRLERNLQHRLAAYLDSREFLELDVRILACAENGTDTLDETLRQRLDVMRCQVPSLRERREDIIPLAERLMDDLAREYGLRARSLSTECENAFRTHDWPGNIGELRNLCERLVLSVSGPVVQAGDLPENMGGPAGMAVDLYGGLGTLDEAVAAFERYYIRRALVECRADSGRAADDLGIEPDELERRIRELGIDRPS